MNNWIKTAGLSIALAATAVTAAAPAEAQRWRGDYGWRHRGGGGNAAAGALLGGIVGLGVGAAIASGNRGYNRNYYYYDAPPPPPPPPVYRDYYYDNYYQPQCWTQWRYDQYGYRVPVRVCQ